MTADNSPTRWLNVALEINRLDHSPDFNSDHHRGPTFSSRSLAIVLRAMAEAYFLGDTAKLPLSPLRGPAAAGTDAASALHGASVAVLSSLFPKLRAFVLAEAAKTPPRSAASADYGAAVAYAHVDARANDGWRDTIPYRYRSVPGAHQPDPDNGSSAVDNPHWGNLQPFGVDLPRGRHLPLLTPPGYAANGDHQPDDPAYLRDFDQVKLQGHKGIASDPADAAAIERAFIGTFWAYDGPNLIGTPPRLYLQIVRDVACMTGMSEEQCMFLYALVGTAMGDAGIHAWHYKYAFNVWRPVVGIRHRDDARGNAFWLPLGAPRSNRHKDDRSDRNNTPPFPAYPSGHATFGSAAFTMLKLVLGAFSKGTRSSVAGENEVGFEFVSDELDGVARDVTQAIRPRRPRKFQSIEEAIIENGISRVYLGVHWAFDARAVDGAGAELNIGGVPLGRAIARNVFAQWTAQAGELG